MKKEGYYSSGEFAKLAHVTKKTLRYYNDHGYLKPSLVDDKGARFYTTEDLGKLQQILLFKFLGFPLEDIRALTLEGDKEGALTDSLKLQLELLENRMEQMKLVKEVLQDTIATVEQKETVDWSRLIRQIDLAGLENSLKAQYRNASNISARISLHKQYAANKQGWFPWVYENCDIQSGMTILELGCGDGSFWLENKERIPRGVTIYATDLSEGMLRDMKKRIGEDERFVYKKVDMNEIPFEDASIDLVVANHVLFYATNFPQVLGEIARVLKPGAKLVCGTYGTKHMKEVSILAKDFDDRIILAAENLYELFGKENGSAILEPYFKMVNWKEYEDHLLVTEADALLSYILSCHGNQNQYIVEKYKEFRSFVQSRVKDGFYITKEAGVFVTQK